jgi:predicted P-loop ATPase
MTKWQRFLPMTKTLTVDVQRKNAERQLFGSRRALGHLLELYESGQWKSLYKEAAFAEAVRQARQAVDHWTNVVSRPPEA